MTAPDRGDIADETPMSADRNSGEGEQPSRGRTSRDTHDEAVYRRSAEDGDAEAMVELGVLLQNRAEFDEAEQWYRRAAEAGQPEAILLLGIRRHRRRDFAGASTQFDRLQQMIWRGCDERATDLAPELHYRLGLMSEDQGRLGEAKSWFANAAHAGHQGAMFALGVLFRNNGDRFGAETWFRRAADCGDDAAMYELAVLLRDHGDRDEAEQWFTRSAHRAAGPFGGTRAATRTQTGPALGRRDHRDEIAQFYASVQPALHAYARRGATDISDAADIVQDAMIRLILGWERFRVLPRDELVAIAFASVRFSWLDRRREQHRGARYGVEVPVDYLAEISDPAAVEGYEGLIAEETARKALLILPLRQREIMSRVIQGRTIATIAAELGMNEATVRRLLQRARTRIADELDIKPRRTRGGADPNR